MASSEDHRCICLVVQLSNSILFFLKITLIYTVRLTSIHYRIPGYQQIVLLPLRLLIVGQVKKKKSHLGYSLVIIID
jgi:hypothetical protein